jgi:hypothetical protein
MPYILREAQEKGEKGYKVCKKDEPKRCFSKHPLPLERAQKQRTAIILSELGRSRRGGDGMKKTEEKVMVGKRSHCVYVDGKGVKYVRKDGAFEELLLEKCGSQSTL